MSIERLLRTPCTIHHRAPSGTDDYGNPVDVETGTTATLCWLDPTSGIELTVGGTVRQSDWSLYLPSATVLDAGDVVEVEGVTYEVTAPPRRFVHPTRLIEHHVEVNVRVVV